MTTQMDLEGTVLSEIHQTEKDKNCIVSLICGIYRKKKQKKKKKERKSKHIEIE